MKLYLAPMEGVTGYVFRNVQNRYFGHIDRCFTPFITPNQSRKLTSREMNDVLPEHNRGMDVVPQILTNRAEDFIWAAEKLRSLGYDEVNLNLGCPSGTVVSKHRGAGFLEQTQELNRFLEQVSGALEEKQMKLSVKTRLGMGDPEEFYDLIPIFNRYPLSELIIHPRVRTDYYKNSPNLELFEEALKLSGNPVCYNGDLFNRRQYEAFTSRFPQVDRGMIGRGLIANPGLAAEIREDKPLDKQTLRNFHDALLQGYQEAVSGDRNVLFKMKEMWHYMSGVFTDSEKHMKKIKKSVKMEDYMAAVSRLFEERELARNPGYIGKETTWERP